MIKSFVLALASAAALSLSTAAGAAPVTYRFAGQVAADGDLAGQAVSGTFTVDPTLYTNVFSDGSTFAWATLGDAPSGASRVDLRIGAFGETVGSTASSAGGFHINLFKNWFAEGATQGLDAYEVSASSIDPAGHPFFVTLMTDSTHVSPNPMFPGAAGDLSPAQPVSFLTPGSFNIGVFDWTSADGATEFSNEFSITSISAVPEVPTGALFAGALALFALRRRASRAAVRR
jgi:hypothetical protein